MHDLLLDRPPFYVSGLLLGLAVVGLLALAAIALGTRQYLWGLSHVSTDNAQVCTTDNPAVVPRAP